MIQMKNLNFFANGRHSVKQLCFDSKQQTRQSFSVKLVECINLTLSDFFFLKLGFTPCKVEQPLHGTELQEKETQKD